MERYRRIGAFLKGSPADTTVLQFTARVAELTQCERIKAVHFREEHTWYEEPDPTGEEFQDQVTAALPESLHDRLACEVHKGTGIREVLISAKDMDLDLVVCGRRLPYSHDSLGTNYLRLVRKAPCDVLIVPEQAYVHFARYLIPVDFSEYSKMAVQTAADLAQAAGETNPQLVCCHGMSVGYGFSKTGSSMAQYVAKLETETRGSYAEFIAQIDAHGVEVEPIFAVSDVPVDLTNALAVARKMDVVVIGSRGRSGVAALLGRTATSMVERCAVPILVVKKKGESRRFLDALLNI